MTGRRGARTLARGSAGVPPAAPRWGEKAKPPFPHLFAPSRLRANFSPLGAYHAQGGAVEADLVVVVMVCSVTLMPSHWSLG